MYIEVNKVGDNYEVTPNIVPPTPVATIPVQRVEVESYDESWELVTPLSEIVFTQIYNNEYGWEEVVGDDVPRFQGGSFYVIMNSDVRDYLSSENIGTGSIQNVRFTCDGNTYEISMEDYTSEILTPIN
jgi:hypothetical protein